MASNSGAARYGDAERALWELTVSALLWTDTLDGNLPARARFKACLFFVSRNRTRDWGEGAPRARSYRDKNVKMESEWIGSQNIASIFG